MYKRYERPSARVAHGLSTSWEPFALTLGGGIPSEVVWSPCNRFIAVTQPGVVRICDAVTLALLSTLKRPLSLDLSLCFSPDSRFLAQFGPGRSTSWDLKTGASVKIDVPGWPFAVPRQSSPVYSIDGKMLAVVSSSGYDLKSINIITCDPSTTQIHMHPAPEGDVLYPIWTHGESLRFATLEPEHITIWEVDFTLTHPPEAVEYLLTPGQIPDTGRLQQHFFHPTLSRLATTFSDALWIWDVRKSELLLKTPSSITHDMAFSPDGLFFASLLRDYGEVRVWKESLSGYILHQQLAVPLNIRCMSPIFSPDGASLIICQGSTIHLWHTKDPILSQSHSVPRSESILGFSPGETLAAFTDKFGNTVTVLDLQSGDPQLVIDVGMGVRCLGVTSSTIVVVSEEKIVAWNVAAGDAKADISDSIWNTTFDLSRPSPFGQSHQGRSFAWMSISPDLSRIVTSGYGTNRRSTGVEIHDVSTGRCLASVELGTGLDMLLTKFKVADKSEGERIWRPFFTPDGREIYGICDRGFRMDGQKIIDDESGTTKLQPLDSTTLEKGVFPWQSSHGYKVTDDWWIMSPTGKRVLCLPHEWRLDEKRRTWSGQFLGLTHRELSEVVILEFFD